MTSQHFDILCLSPHLDDAVFSCCGYLMQQKERGRNILVAVLFDSCDPNSPFAAEYDLRDLENQQALEELGISGINLGYLDAPFRNPFYDSFSNILLDANPQNAAKPENLEQHIAELIDKYQPAVLMIPFGAGTHIDHRLTFSAARTVIKTRQEIEVIFYEDRPFSFVYGQLYQRFLEINARCTVQTPPDLKDRPILEWTQAMLNSMLSTQYIKTFFPPGRKRLESMLKTVRRFRLKRTETELPVSPGFVVFDRDKFRILQHVISAYTNQLPDFFGGLAGFTAETLAYSELLGYPGKYCERYWKLMPDKTAQ